MKKAPYIILISCLFINCTSKKEETLIKNPDQNGYTVAKSSNIDLVKKFNKKAFELDTTALKSYYSSKTDTIHDNLTTLTVNQNCQLLGKLKASKIKFKIKNYSALWETINDEANLKGVKNFVIAYLIVNASNGKSNNDILLNQVCAVKDGKIVEEWDVYDAKKIDELLN